MAAEGNKKNATQARGRVRRQLLCRAAAELLETHDLDAISLGDVAALANVPKGSAYHFYTNIYDLYLDLVAEVGAGLAENIVLPADSTISSWQDVVAASLTRSRRRSRMSTHHNEWLRGDQQVPSPSMAAASHTQRRGLVGVGIDRTER